MGASDFSDAGRLRRRLVRGAPEARRPGRLRPLEAGGAGTHRRRRSTDAPAVVPALSAGGRLRRGSAGRDQGRRHQRGASHRLDGRGIRRSFHPSRLEHGGRPGGRPATGLGLPQYRPGRVPHRERLRGRDCRGSLATRSRRYADDSRHTRLGSGTGPGRRGQILPRRALAGVPQRSISRWGGPPIAKFRDGDPEPLPPPARGGRSES